MDQSSSLQERFFVKVVSFYCDCRRGRRRQPTINGYKSKLAAWVDITTDKLVFGWKAGQKMNSKYVCVDMQSFISFDSSTFTSQTHICSLLRHRIKYKVRRLPKIATQNINQFFIRKKPKIHITKSIKN